MSETGHPPVPSLWAPCTKPQELHWWVRTILGVKMPQEPVCAGHCAPFEYLRRAYFEPASDLVVWAPRGGGKTRLGAIATLLDLLHKPGVAVRILGGSLEQSLKMWEHLCSDVEATQIPTRRAQARVLKLRNRSVAAVLAQSQRAVRGQRVQKMRCDEVELFDPRIWEAAQLVTRSIAPGATRKATVEARGVIEAFSTLHRPGGMMARIVDRAQANGARVLKWCLLEVLDRCEPQRECGGCPLWDECGGVAKSRCDGFFSIDDAIAMKKRVSEQTWQSEMLCQRPSSEGLVFPTFDPGVHVQELAPVEGETAEVSLAMDFGFAAPFVCLWISRLGERVHVIDEYVQAERTIDVHLAEIERRGHGHCRRIACDPAGAARNEQTARSNIEHLRERGYTVRHRQSRIVDGIEMIRSALRPAWGRPRLSVSGRCARLIAALQAYAYAPGGGEVPVKDGDHDHLIDALRYWMVNRNGWKQDFRFY